jgi:hypothetical protein
MLDINFLKPLIFNWGGIKDEGEFIFELGT